MAERVNQIRLQTLLDEERIDMNTDKLGLDPVEGKLFGELALHVFGSPYWDPTEVISEVLRKKISPEHVEPSLIVRALISLSQNPATNPRDPKSCNRVLEMAVAQQFTKMYTERQLTMLAQLAQLPPADQDQRLQRQGDDESTNRMLELIRLTLKAIRLQAQHPDMNADQIIAAL